MQRIQHTIPLQVYASDAELPESERQLLAKAKAATYQSYAPYSNFHVGAAVLLQDGSIHAANNQENAAFPSGSCAEQSVIYWVGANYPTQRIVAIAVVARPGKGDAFKGVSPCGACRQSMLEYEVRQRQAIRLIMVGANDQIIVSESITNLLPVKFDGDDLNSLQDKT
ncbi:MAG: cytidine deaminase [Spirosomataceae bacterium]